MQQVGWLQLFETFDRDETQDTKAFNRDFDGFEVNIRDIKLILTQSIVVEATRFLRNAKILFKNRKIKENDWVNFLREPGVDLSILKNGIPGTTLKG